MWRCGWRQINHKRLANCLDDYPATDVIDLLGFEDSDTTNYPEPSATPIVKAIQDYVLKPRMSIKVKWLSI